MWRYAGVNFKIASVLSKLCHSDPEAEGKNLYPSSELTLFVPHHDDRGVLLMMAKVSPYLRIIFSSIKHG
jgi:hypothetical protein